MQEKNEGLYTPIRYCKGVGPKKSEQLARLGIHSIADLLYFAPRKYEDRSKITAIKDVAIGECQTIQADIASVSSRRSRRGMSIVKVSLKDETGTMKAVWFNQPFISGLFKAGMTAILSGKVELHDSLQMNHPEFEVMDKEESEFLSAKRIVPVYSLTERITQRYIRRLADRVVDTYAKQVRDILPTNIRARERLVDIKFALENIHFPASFENLEKAHKRLIFEEFFLLQLVLAIRRHRVRSGSNTMRHTLKGDLIELFARSIPFELTDGQKKAIGDIEKDMSSSRPMNRLLEGDVGSGKTIVAAHALVLTVQNGFQGVIMAPTEVLARQHYVVLSKICMPLGINVVFLARGVDADRKKALSSEMADGRANIVVGTHAVIQTEVTFRSVGLVIIDEQHKFGVMQRAILREKGEVPHVLVMTATPIPRTLALTVFGDLDISIIRDLPSGRRPIMTYWVEEKKRRDVYQFVREEVKKGRQAFIVYPIIERSDSLQVRSAKEMYETIRKEEFPDFTVGLLHGKMSPAQKDSVMKDFKTGAVNVLVSTVVIEVGIDIPNATCMVIENAERFGLSQLHQLRGRIGRGAHESYCILLANPTTEMAQKRLCAIKDTIDGFKIAEEDLSIRGPGELTGTRQHGLLELRFGDVVKDFDIMQSARREAFGLMREDPDLEGIQNRLLKEELGRRHRSVHHNEIG
ncbi:MAG: ATP-dependent DNA helicase RecG [Candidatus Omnitrophota bacterium]